MSNEEILNEEHEQTNENDNSEETTEIVETPQEEVAETIEEENSEEKESEETHDNESVSSDDPQFSAPVNEEALQNQMSEFEKLKSEISSFLESFSDSEDLKLLRKNIVTFKEQLDALFLVDINIKDPLIDTLQKTFEEISAKREQLREERNKIFDENLTKIKASVDDTLKQAAEHESFKEARNLLINIQKEVRSFELRNSDKDSLFEQIQKAFENVNERQQAYRESYEMECSENYLNIKPHVLATVEKAKETERFNDSRKMLIDLQKQIKDLTLSKNQRDELYQVIREVFNEINEKQDKDRASFVEEAKANFEKAKPEVENAIKAATSPENINNSRNILIEAQKMLKDLALTKEHRDELFGAIREVFNKLNEQMDENREEFEQEATENFAKLEVKVNEAIANVEYSNDFKDIREGLIAVQDEIKIVRLKRSQRNDLLSRIRKAFERFDKKRDSFFQKRREEKASKLQGIIDNLNEKISRLNEANTSDNSQLEQLTSQLESAENKEEIESNINNFKEKIESRNKSIQESQDRIEDINKELAEMNEKK